MKRELVRVFGVTLAAALVLAAPAYASAHVTRAGAPLPPTASPGAVAVTGPNSPSMAAFNGTTIDLKNGWDGAQSCIVPTNGQTECFSTNAAAKAAAQAISASEQNAASAPLASSRAAAKSLARASLRHGAVAHDNGPCDGDGTQWLWLYQDSNFGGQSLGLQNTDVWADLADFGFADEMSSYINSTGCTAYGIENYDGSGPWLTMNAWDYSTYVGRTYNDKIVAVDIAY